MFKNSVEEIDLRGDNSVDAEWFAYIGAFIHLRSLNVSDCRRLSSSALWAVAGIALSTKNSAFPGFLKHFAHNNNNNNLQLRNLNF